MPRRGKQTTWVGAAYFNRDAFRWVELQHAVHQVQARPPDVGEQLRYGNRRVVRLAQHVVSSSGRRHKLQVFFAGGAYHFTDQL
jgi:chemotaxis receptor (MCP) glutamine deamidase CheD